MVAKRSLTNRANLHTPMSFKAQHSRIPIDPAILAAIGHHFIAKKGKLKMPMRRSEAMCAETRNCRLFFVGLKVIFLNFYMY